MDTTTPKPLQRITLGLLLLLVILAPITWYLNHDRLPQQIRIATGTTGGLYYQFGQLLSERLNNRIDGNASPLETSGSQQNLELLHSNSAELGIMQLDIGAEADVYALAPVFNEVVHVVVRKGSGIRSISDLRNKAVALGPIGSGMRVTALKLLGYYNILNKELRSTEQYFMALADDETLEGAIITTGLLNPDLEQLLHSGRFELLPVENASAITLHTPHYILTQIPRGYFSADPPVPHKAIETYATPAFLGVRADASERLVTEVLDALYESDMRNQIASFVPQHEATNWSFVRPHPAAQAYFNPYEGLGVLANFVESLAGIKELLFAIGAGIYMLWRWRRRALGARKAMEVAQQKERLDRFLNQTIEIEKAQMKTEDPVALRKYLDQVTLTKLAAIQELTHEELRGDRLFSIFLAQCGHLTQKIHSKINHATRGQQ